MLTNSRRSLFLALFVAAAAALPSSALAGGVPVGGIKITAPLEGGQVISGKNRTVTGTAPAGVTSVTVYFKSAPTETRTAKVDNNGKWEVSVPTPTVSNNTKDTVVAEDSNNTDDMDSKGVTILASGS